MLPHIATRVFNTPLMLHPTKAQVIAHALADRLNIEAVAHVDGSVKLTADFGKPAKPTRSGVDRVGPLGIIQVQGTLVQRTGNLRPYSGMTGYDGIRANLESAVSDADIKAIVLEIDSPGGEVAGCFALADAIFDARSVKPVFAVLDESAYSAAYAIASAARKVFIPRTGGAGSVGVITMHADMHRALEHQGVDVTIITHGDLKDAGTPTRRLDVDTHQRIQADIDTLGEMFLKLVARNRKMSVDDVRAMQAGTFLGQQAVDVGLADQVSDADKAAAAILESFA